MLRYLFYCLKESVWLASVLFWLFSFPGALAFPQGTKSILSWNCRGLGKAPTIRASERVTFKHKSSNIIPMETKQKSAKLERIRSRLGFFEGFYVEPEG